MLDVIVYEDDEVSINRIKKIVNRTLGDYGFEYRISVFKKYNDLLLKMINNDNKKIYLINLETDKNSGLKLSSDIRKKDLNDIVILTAKCGKYYEAAFSNQFVAFDYICKCDDYNKRLFNTFAKVCKVLCTSEMFVFKYKRMIYRIPYRDINYVEKETNIKRCIIHTITEEYYIVSSIDKLLEELNRSFIKTHQSCIVNLNNIKLLDCVNNRIVFANDDYTSLVTENAKREIKKWLFN